ncbi:hypothetical protein DBB29_01580 [Pandoraea cepalis]|uniref:Transposase n=1 Tax=Pandoraea cepalis TaxID=2508294 RepID=A0AAW7MGM4_9BURK|nr:hypothetical protein [Pandoraea cepalis]MDN4576816.1 hypothetical protein [Pandoraea cepalis]
MYSYEDRIGAVELYIKLGKRTRATIRQLGYPTKNALKSWHREYERHHDLATGYVRAKPKYSADQKKIAVENYLSHGQSIVGTLEALGYPGRASLAAWINELHSESRRHVVGKPKGILQTRAFKQPAVIEICTRSESAHVIARKAGVRRETLYNWKDQLLGRKAPASMKRQNDSPSIPERAKLECEVESWSCPCNSGHADTVRLMTPQHA